MIEKAAQTTPLKRRVHAKVCRECGAPASDWVRQRGHFCCDVCRRDWNNRRKARGAILYDLIMALRYERKASKALGVWSLACRLCATWREIDAIDLKGRRSWRDSDQVISERPWLFARVMKTGRKL